MTSSLLLPSSPTMNFIVSISLPLFKGMDIAHINPVNIFLEDYPPIPVVQIRFGIWSACTCYPLKYDYCDQCSHITAVGYNYNYTLPSENKIIQTVQSSWTRILIVHPIATLSTLFVFVPIHYSPKTKAVPFCLFAAALVTLLALVFDIALFALVKHKMAGLEGVSTKIGPGLWLTLIIFFILSILGGYTLSREKNRAKRPAIALTALAAPLTAPLTASEDSPFKMNPRAITRPGVIPENV